MRAQTMHWQPETGWSQVPPWVDDTDLVLYFGTTPALGDPQPYLGLRAHFPTADLLGCSTGSQIIGTDVDDDAVTAVALNFDQVEVRCAHCILREGQTSEDVGELLALKLKAHDLGAVLILSDGLHINGTQLVAGMVKVLGDAIPLFGGLAGDGARFERTLVGLNEGPQERRVVAIGLHGPALRVSHAAAGGWDLFGPQRTISASHDNVLEQLDGKPALDLYERYLGDEAEGLPGTALLYPLCIWHDELHPEPQVRTVLSIDTDKRTMTFAGDIPNGWSAQLMRGVHERLVAGAAAAALVARQDMASDCIGDTLALMVSCVGRRLLMGAKTVDEAEAVADALGPGVIKLGFYSYGEIAPREAGGRCDLHNQTMTVALIGEVAV